MADPSLDRIQSSFSMSSASEGQRADVFLSYASDDSVRALAIADALVAAGVQVWIDRRGIAGGTAWAQEIVVAVRACNVVAVLCSAASMRSRNVRQELQLAWDCDRPILPLLLERVDFPDTVAYFLQGRQWVEILDRPDAEWTVDVLAALVGLDARPVGDPPRAASAVGAIPVVGAASRPDTTRLGNLPAPPTPIVGRSDEVTALSELLALRGTRLVTLTGPGGVGKTRLALEAAALVRHAFPGGVWWADLTPVRDIGLVLPTIARALELREEGDRPLRDRMAAFLQGQRLLLLLDNFEQVVAAGPAVAELLAVAPDFTVLATSRTPLRLRAEREIAVAPLALPPTGHHVSAADVAQAPAVALFQERAAAAKIGFAVTADNAPAVTEICRRLDGLPLAIELAAARVRLLPPSALLARLDDRLKVLAGGALDLPERQRTMRDAIAWSYDLLDPSEQAFFCRLSVFAGSFDLEAAEAVAGHPGADQSALDLLDGLARLVDHSLLRQQETAEGEPRFAMLATIREYGLMQLAEHAETDVSRQQHAAFFLALAERSAPKLTRSEQHTWVRRLDADHDDLRSALQWTAKNAPEHMLRLAGALFRFWYIRGYASEGRAWLDQALVGAGEVDPIILAKALYAASVLAWAQGDLNRALDLGEQSLAMYQDLGNRAGIANALNIVGAVTTDAGNLDRAAAILEEELILQRDLNDPWGLGVALSNLAEIMRYRDDSLANQLEARARFEEALELLRPVGDEAILAHITRQLGLIASAAGELDRACAALVESLDAFERLGDRRGVAGVLAGVAEVAVRRGHPERAARLLGGEAAIREVIGAPVIPGERPWHEHLKAIVRSTLGDDVFAAVWSLGINLPMEEVVAEAVLEAKQLGPA